MRAVWLLYLASFVLVLIETELAVSCGPAVAGLAFCVLAGIGLTWWSGARRKELHFRIEEVMRNATQLESAREKCDEERRAVEARRGEIEARHKAIAKQRSALERDIERRRVESQRQTAAVEALRGEIARQAAEQGAQFEALQAELQSQRTTLDDDRRQWDARQNVWNAAHAAEIEELAARRAEFETLRGAFEETRAASELQQARSRAQLEARTAALEAGEAELDKRTVESSAGTAALEVRAAELTSRAVKLDARHADVRTRIADVDSRTADLNLREAELSARAADMESRVTGLWISEVALSCRAAVLENFAADLSTRDRHIEVRSAALSARAIATENRDAELSTRAAELEKRAADLDTQVAVCRAVARSSPPAKSQATSADGSETALVRNDSSGRVAIQGPEAPATVVEANVSSATTMALASEEGRIASPGLTSVDPARSDAPVPDIGPRVAAPPVDEDSSRQISNRADAQKINGPIYAVSVLTTSAPENPPSEHLSSEPPRAESRQQEPRIGDAAPRSQAAYIPPRAPQPTVRTDAGDRRIPRVSPRAEAGLGLQLQLLFGRGRDIKRLALVPDRRNGMPSQVRVVGTRGEHDLTKLRDDCYEPVSLDDSGEVLLSGIEWCGRGDARRWRWLLTGRAVYVLAPGDQFGLSGFVSAARLALHARHVVLARAEYRNQVLAALGETGCVRPAESDEGTLGVPHGWLLFRDVVPTRAVPMRDEADILNALCPSHELDANFGGGVRLTRRTWLAGFPPRIHLTGDLAPGFRLAIDGQPIRPAPDGTIEAPNWDAVGEHRLLFGDKSITYELRRMEEEWNSWPAYDFRTGAAICGGSVVAGDGARYRAVQIPSTNPVLVGSREGEIFHCRARNGVRSDTIVAMVPFAPVWALPADPAHADKARVRVLRLGSAKPNIGANGSRCSALSAPTAWASTINEARRKRLALADESEEAKELWRCWCAAAKRIWRKAR